MKKRQLVALVGAGKLTDSPVTRFWGLTNRLGPVKAPSLRLASRLVNTLGAGHAVPNYDEFAQCGLILICVPDEAVSATASELAASGISWHNKAVVLCSIWRDGSALSRLAEAGASVGSVAPIPGFDDRKYLVEGDRRVVREAGRLLEHRGTRVVAIEPPLKPFFLASLTCTSTLFYSLLIATADCLRETAIPHAEAAEIIQKQVEKTLRSYFVAGRKAHPETQQIDRQLEALASIRPALAEYVHETSKLAAKLVAKHAFNGR